MKTKQTKRKHEQFRSLAKEFSPEELMEIMMKYWEELGATFPNPYARIKELEEENTFLKEQIEHLKADKNSPSW